jgi:hypothetical protein
MVGQTLGGRLVARGHRVCLGGREVGEASRDWVAKSGAPASAGTFVEAASFGEIVFLCVKGEVAESVAASVASALDGKILVDVTNPLDFSRGFPPALTIQGFDSLGERIQKLAPRARVVKTLNTVAAPVMVEPSLIPRDHDLFVCGEDPIAKERVTTLLREDFGWKHVVDVGGIDAARGTEALLPLWTRLYARFGSPHFNFHIQRG